MLDIDQEWAYHAMSGSYSIRVRPYAGARIDYFATILGEQRVQEIVDEVYRDFDPPDEPGLFQCNIDWRRTLAAGFFGACPRCGHPGDLVNIGPAAWLVCDADSVKWPVWDDVIPDWREQDPTRWVEAIRRTADYREVTPAYPARRNHLVIVKDAPKNTDME